MSASQPSASAARVPTMPVKVGASIPFRKAPVPATVPQAAPQQATTSATPTPPATVQSFTVRMQRNTKKNFSIMKFSGAPVDFAKSGPVKMERENNYKDFRLAHDIDVLPKYGAGSEFGRQQRDEARRKKFGMATRKYSPYKQPWLMRVGNGKNARKFKGTKEGGITENTSYFMFKQCPDGAFEACPVDEWYTFNPTIKYKYLNSEEAEEEFSRRDKNLNLRTIMLKKRLKGEEGLDEEEEAELKGKKVVKKTKKDKSKLKLTEMEDWDDDEDDSADGSDDSDAEKKKKSKEAPKKRRNRGGKANSDNEAMEESDDADEGAEVDYMTSSDSEEEMMFQQDKLLDKDTYEEKGVAEEQGLLTLIDSGAEDEEEEDKKEENEDEDEEDEKKEKKAKKDANESDSMSSSSSDSDSDVDEPNINSALFLGTKKADKGTPDKAAKKKRRPSLSSEGSAATNSRSATPSVDQGDESGKRSATDSPVLKKARMETPTLPSGSSEGITDEAVRRYLMRKPMTTKDILQKFKSKKTGMTNEQMVNAIAQALKRINPGQQKVKDKLYLYLKKS